MRDDGGLLTSEAVVSTVATSLSGCVLRLESVGFSDGLPVGFEIKSQEGCKVIGLNECKYRWSPRTC